MKKDSIYYLKKLKKDYLLLRSGEILLLALTATCLVFGVTTAMDIGLWASLILAVFMGAIVFTTAFLRSKLHRFNENRLTVFIDHQYPVMQHSTDLLFKDAANLTWLQQIQKEKIRVNFEQICSTIKLPHHIGRASIFLGMSILLTSILFLFTPETVPDPPKKSETALVQKTRPSAVPASLKEVMLNINPPAYTGVASYSTKGPQVSVPEGSRVLWQIVFTDSVQHPHLVFLRNDSVELKRSQQKYKAERSFTESNLYQFSWTSSSAVARTSDYFKVEVIRDQPPKIAVPQQPEYTEISLADKQNVLLKVNFSDDYGLHDAYIIATVSKGSGESVKFREEKLLFTSPANVRGRRAEASRTIDVKNLGLEPGDELYFYIEALDNKRPSANRARTQTYFISLRDTSSQMLLVESGLGVHLMPAYFRSQRQIIIDSEKLLRERKSIRSEEFNSRSNEIGYDQKVLRLKYGEFLGEEFETAIGQEGEEPEEEGHDHKGAEEDDPTEAYKHVHDHQEEATFLTQSIRSKLKAALTAMWDAELHLRAFDPEKSLPYQYIALRLLKDISNDSRIYVHKSGFDPPPLKEERRLTGNLSEIKHSVHNQEVDQKETYPAIRLALGILEEHLAHSDIYLTVKAKQSFLQAGQELAALALENPGNYLHALSLIKSLTENELPAEEIQKSVLFLREVFWQVLPKEMASPDRSFESIHGLDRTFINHLKSLKND
ncbi:MAG: DUF4175 family protein [Cyclobacteriaceae bacterium]